MMHQLILFASGRGSNAGAIIDHFRQNGKARVALIVTNKADAGVLDIARAAHIPFLIIDRKTFGEALLIDQLQEHRPALIVLAGFLWKIPAPLVQAFAGRIINIHPALLPKYGGKGMYGHHVHEAVIRAGEAQSGITIHQVNEAYDEGAVILQAACPVQPGDTADTLAENIHRLEHFYFPRTLEFLLDQQEEQPGGQ